MGGAILRGTVTEIPTADPISWLVGQLISSSIGGTKGLIGTNLGDLDTDHRRCRSRRVGGGLGRGAVECLRYEIGRDDGY